MLSTEHHTDKDVADCERERHIAHDLSHRPVRIGYTAIVDALYCKEADVGCKDDGRLSLLSAAIAAIRKGWGRTGVMEEFQSSWSSPMNFRQK